MARLSVEHYRAKADMTPEHVRKSSRLRNMFKSRSTSTNSLIDPSTRSPPAKSPLSPPNPPTSPSVKPGFEQVGLLPSEQESIMDVKTALEDNGGSRVAEVLEKQVQDLKGYSVPHNVDTKLDVVGADHVDQDAKTAKEKRHCERIHKIAVEFKDAVADDQNVNAGRCENDEKGSLLKGIRVLGETNETPIHILRHSKSQEELSAENYESSSTKAHAGHSAFDGSETGADRDAFEGFSDWNYDEDSLGLSRRSGTMAPKPNVGLSWERRRPFIRAPRPLIPEGAILRDVSEPSTFYNDSDGFQDVNDKEDQTTNGLPLISDQQTPHSLPVPKSREWVAKDMATMPREQEDEIDKIIANIPTKTVGLEFRAKFMKQDELSTTVNSTADSAETRVKLFEGPRSIGNITVVDPILTFTLQLIVVAVYSWLALRIVIAGPNAMFYPLAMTSAVLIAYRATKTGAGNVDQDPDLLLSPLGYASEFIMDKVTEVAHKTAWVMVKMFVEALREAADEIKVEVKNE